jgi:hypothetical protein
MMIMLESLETLQNSRNQLFGRDYLVIAQLCVGHKETLLCLRVIDSKETQLECGKFSVAHHYDDSMLGTVS